MTDEEARASDNGDNEPAPEVSPAMATKGQGWSGRDEGSEESSQEGSSEPDQGGKGDGRKSSPKPPSMGTGRREGAGRTLGPVEVDERFQDVDDPLKEIPDDEEVDPQEVLKDARIGEVLERMDRELVALNAVKDRIREIASLLLIDRLRRSLGLEADPPTLHMCFTGNPGTGKTTVAMRMGEILYKLGYIRKGHLVSVTRDDLVGQYVGHTAPKTREVLKRAMGGVLFIDEAYHIYRVDNERDYGQETVELLLQVMENQREDLVVVMAGYKDQMDRFFSDVPGLSSRIGHHIDFPDYNAEELMEIARLMTEEQRYRFTPEAEKAFQEYLEKRMQQPRFANGRSVRNALDRLRMRQALRLYEMATSDHRRLTKKDLVTIDAEDIHKSRVFGGGAYGGEFAADEDEQAESKDEQAESKDEQAEDKEEAGARS